MKNEDTLPVQKKGQISENNKKRDANFEILRILCMFMIVVWHFLMFNTQLNNTMASQNSFLLVLLRQICSVAVNCYILISGFYLVKSRWNTKKIMNIWGKTIFYSITLFALAMLCKQHVDFEKYKDTFLPIIGGAYWFITSYIALYLVSPFLTILVHHISKKQFKALLVILIVITCGIKSIFPDFIGHSFAWFVVLYLVAAYIRLYVEKKEKRNIVRLAGYLVCTMASLLVFYLAKYLPYEYDKGITYEYNFLFVFLASLFLFLFFRNLKVGNETIQKAAIKLAPLTLGIYLIHENPFVRGWLWNQISFPTYLWANPLLLGGYVFFYAFLVFVVCTLIEWARNGFASKIRMKKLTTKVDQINETIMSYFKE